MSDKIFQPDTFRGMIYFLWAGALQLTGAYFLWSGMRGDKPIAIGVLGGALVLAAALVMGLQQSSFGRAYAAYAGVLALMALLWGWHYTGIRPDIIDVVGGIMVLGGIGIIILTPRH